MKIIYIILFLFFFAQNNQIKSQPSESIPFSVSIIVKDIDTAAKWYMENLGLKIRNINENKERNSKIVNLENGNFLVELIKISSSVDRNEALEKYPAGSRFAGFMKTGFVTEKFNEWHSFLKNQKVKFRGTIVTDSHSGKRTFLIEDPEGNVLQFFEK